jgi:hypothetical protein
MVWRIGGFAAAFTTTLGCSSKSGFCLSVFGCTFTIFVSPACPAESAVCLRLIEFFTANASISDIVLI